ncbi:hypothetical protein B7H18_04035 [Pseudomonas putida]|uniref:Uncharacterized protein n=1 Tax=Pseudomonas putida TaxID=303 RepID=A0A1X0ZJM9_PSEPU|nr:hypothetical protein B7H18_04035 [Pseudomonas putida]ORL58923.1 hypothetical protein B7H17_25555 [Pseudomonas putida]ORL67203.1 hypothetical protein B7H19_18750 [Pseudomonas putida]
MRDLAAAHEASRDDPVPTCHFRAMTFHESDSNPDWGGYQCDHCGHTESVEEAWAKIEARSARAAKHQTSGS